MKLLSSQWAVIRSGRLVEVFPDKQDARAYYDWLRFHVGEGEWVELVGLTLDSRAEVQTVQGVEAQTISA
jgi:hypothetical protein